MSSPSKRKVFFWVRGTASKGGGTFSRRAIETLYQDIGSPYHVNRNTYFVIVSDGVVNHPGQYPCDNFGVTGGVDEVIRSGIQIIALLMSEEGDITMYECLHEVYPWSFLSINENLCRDFLLTPFCAFPSKTGKKEEAVMSLRLSSWGLNYWKIMSLWHGGP